MLHVFEWAGSILGLLGSFLLATNSQVSRHGWIAFFVSNLAMMVFAFKIDADGLLLQQVGFTGTTLLGIYRFWLAPWLRQRRVGAEGSAAGAETFR